ncbi:MAG: ORF6N domain-containing protein [Saprospiraceae bacterium]|nr:ORF6N domain-containing protein [Saprospiraceae bacterium]
MTENLILKEDNIASIIYMIRGEKVMLDADLAALYGVETRTLKQAVKRNIERFPLDFMFELTKDEVDNLRSQIVISSWGGRRYLPHAFTEQGVAMLSGILNSERAIAVNIAIMRTFVQIRKLALSNLALTQRVEKLESLIQEHLEDYGEDMRDIYEALSQLTQEPENIEPRRIIGFKNNNT